MIYDVLAVELRYNPPEVECYSSKLLWGEKAANQAERIVSQLESVALSNKASKCQAILVSLGAG